MKPDCRGRKPGDKFYGLYEALAALRGCSSEAEHVGCSLVRSAGVLADVGGVLEEEGEVGVRETARDWGGPSCRSRKTFMPSQIVGFY